MIPGASTDPALLAKYREDLTEAAGHSPDAVIVAESVDDVRRALAEATRSRTPVIPVVANTNVGGLAIPERGGIILDLSRLNRIVEISEADLYAVIEPGVTWGQLKEHLDGHHPSLRFGYALSPPDASVLANFLLDGLTNLSLRHGSTSDWINGVEAVLATGETVKTGLAAFGSPWCGHSPLPGLTGLFVNMHGTTGIVTKMSVQLWPQRKFRRRYFLPARDAGRAIGAMIRLARQELLDDIGGIGWPLAKQLFGIARPLHRDPGEPELYVLLDFSSDFDDDLDHKDRLLRRLLAPDAATFDELLEVESLVRMIPEFAAFADLPARLGFLLDHPGKGLTWIGTYGPTSRWAEGYAKALEVMDRHGFPPAAVLRPMRSGHFGVLRMIVTFDKADAEERRRVHELNVAMCDAVVPLGFMPYKTPPWVLKRFASRIDPGFLALLDKVRAVMDPAGILNPGKWRPS